MKIVDAHVTADSELVSALLDGELAPDSWDRAISLACHAQGRGAWENYQLIGDVLRSPDLARTTPAGDFVERLSRRLAQEAVPPVPVAVAPAGAVGELPRVRVREEAANDSTVRWKLVAGLATLGAALTLGWSALGPSRPASAVLASASGAAGGMAQGQQAAAGGNERAVMLRDPRLDELLAAHRQVNGHARLGVPGGFVQNATFAAPAR